MIADLAAVVFSATVVCTVLLAVQYNQVPYWPCDISLIATGYPSSIIFAIGLTLTSAMLTWLHQMRDAGRVRRIGQVAAFGMAVLALANARDHIFVHIVGAFVCFTGYLVYTYMKAGPAPLTVVAVGAYALRCLLFVPVVLLTPEGSFWWQLRSLLQHITVVCLLSQVWRILGKKA